MLKTIVEAASGRVPVFAGIAATTPALATELAADAGDAGAEGLMVLPPLLYVGSYEEISLLLRRRRRRHRAADHRVQQPARRRLRPLG